MGLATALAVSERRPQARLLLLEKEAHWAAHQTGHNSGVIHSGIYYRPGSLKATLCTEGRRALVAFCQEHDLPYDLCGKLIVATREEERPRLEALYERGRQNGLEVHRLTPEAARQREPHVRCIAALHVPATGIVDYPRVCVAYAEILQRRGADLRTQARVERLHARPDALTIETDSVAFQARFVVNCTGLQSDRVARLAGQDEARIVPFRGEYYELVPERRDLVRALIYPVPNPEFPFLGVHFTRMIDGNIHAGPNAVLAFKREGYRKTDFSLRDCADTFTYGGFWRLAAKHAGEGVREMARSLSKGLFVRSLQELIPEITAADLVPAGAGVRAQAVALDGRLVDDFLILEGDRSLHVCNAPSPAATASLAIGKAVADRIPLG